MRKKYKKLLTKWGIYDILKVQKQTNVRILLTNDSGRKKRCVKYTDTPESPPASRI